MAVACCCPSTSRPDQGSLSCRYTSLQVWIEVLMHLGFLADFKKAITPIVAASIAEFRARKAGNGPTSTSKKGK